MSTAGKSRAAQPAPPPAPKVKSPQTGAATPKRSATAATPQKPVAKKVPQPTPVEEDEASQSWWQFSTPVLISGGVHLLLMLVTACWTFSRLNEEEAKGLYASQIDTKGEIEELEVVDLEEVEQVKSEHNLADHVEIPPGELVSETTEMDLNGLMPNFDAMSGLNGDSVKINADFFGTKSTGSKFVFVVDNSNSMGRGRLETALVEMSKAVHKMTPKQKFYVVFYSDTAYPLFYPNSSRTLVPATESNKRKFDQWLSTIQMCLRTDGRDAMNVAVSLKPDVIYILGDGAFTDDTAKLLIQNPLRNVTVHTLGMELRKQNAVEFAQIAKLHKGTYRDVGVTKEGQALLKKDGARPKNNRRNGIWGIKLKK